MPYIPSGFRNQPEIVWVVRWTSGDFHENRSNVSNRWDIVSWWLCTWTPQQCTRTREDIAIGRKGSWRCWWWSRWRSCGWREFQTYSHNESWRGLWQEGGELYFMYFCIRCCLDVLYLLVIISFSINSWSATLWNLNFYLLDVMLCLATVTHNIK